MAGMNRRNRIYTLARSVARRVSRISPDQACSSNSRAVQRALFQDPESEPCRHPPGDDEEMTVVVLASAGNGGLAELVPSAVHCPGLEAEVLGGAQQVEFAEEGVATAELMA